MIQPNKVQIYIRLADAYATLGGYNNLKIARDYLCCALGKDSNNFRALWMLILTCNQLKFLDAN